MIRSFEDLLTAVAGRPRRRVAVAGADKRPVFEALSEAVARGWVTPVLVGEQEKVRARADEVGWTSGFEVLDEAGGPERVAARAVGLVAGGQADLLMKGSVPTAALLSAVLDPQAGLRTGSRLSHVAAVEAGGYGRLMLFTDGGINLAPDLETRRQILVHAVEVCRALGNPAPNVAGLALVETENDKLPETREMAQLARWVAGGGLGPRVTMEGPLGLDIALSKAAAELKGVSSEIAGEVDVFLGPDATAVNFTVKGLVGLADAKVAGVVVGARVPIVLLSRSDGPRTRLLSLALALALSA